MTSQVQHTLCHEFLNSCLAQAATTIMESNTDAAPEFVGPAYQPMGKIEDGGEQAYEYVAPKEPTDWGTVEEIRGMMVGHENYFNSQEAYSKYQEFC